MDEISKIPEEIKRRFIKRKFNRGEFLPYVSNGKIGYLLRGEVVGVRYHGDQRAIFPKLLEKGEFLGLRSLFLDGDVDFELEARTDLEVLEIPEDIFTEYILSDLSIQIELLKKINSYLLQGTRAFFIRIHGGTKAYFAYVLYVFSEHSDIVYLKNYTDASDVIFSNKTMFYRIVKEFKERGIIEKNRTTLIVKDRKLLKHYFEEYIY